MRNLPQTGQTGLFLTLKSKVCFQTLSTPNTSRIPGKPWVRSNYINCCKHMPSSFSFHSLFPNSTYYSLLNWPCYFLSMRPVMLFLWFVWSFSYGFLIGFWRFAAKTRTDFQAEAIAARGIAALGGTTSLAGIIPGTTRSTFCEMLMITKGDC